MLENCVHSVHRGRSEAGITAQEMRRHMRRGYQPNHPETGLRNRAERICFRMHGNEENEVDKYEFKLSLNEINALIKERRFEEAAQIADGIDWNHVKSPDTLCRVSEIYKAIGEYNKSRDVMAIAHERDGGNAAIIYALCELTIFLYGRDGLQSDLTLSLQLMQEYKAAEPANPKRWILQYKMYGVSPVSAQEKIAVLEQLRKEKFFPRWTFELAKLYEETGSSDRAAAACREILKNAPGSNYANRAEELLDRIPVSAGSQTAALQNADELQEQDARVSEDAAQGETSSAEPTEEDESIENTADQTMFLNPEKASAKEETSDPAESARSAAAVPAEEPIRTSYDSSRELGNSYAAEGVQEAADPQTESPISISEVMEEWEKIRSNIRRSNDEKRAQRILEDTGTLWRDFDETARHGLLEDIEKGVARQRRQVRSGMYRMGDDAYAGAYPEDRGQAAPAGRALRRAPEESVPVRRAAEDVRPERNSDSEEPAQEREVRRPVPVSNEDDDVKVYGRNDDVEELATRRWNSEEIHRAMVRQEQEALAQEMANAARKRRLQEEDFSEGEDQEKESEKGTAEETAAEIYEEAVPAQETFFEESAGELDSSEEIPAGESTAEEAGELSADAGSEEASEEFPEKETEEELQEAVPHEEPAEDFDEESAREDIEEPCEETESAVESDESVEEQADDVQESETFKEVRETEETEASPAEYEGEPRAERSLHSDRAEERHRREEHPEERRRVEGHQPERRYPGEGVSRRPAGRSENRRQDGIEGAVPAEHRKRPQRPAAAKAAPSADEAPAKKAAHRNHELTKEERRLFGPFCRMRENVEQLTEALDQVSLASSTGNVMIIGNEATAERVAKGILEVTRRADSNFTGKIARVNGSALNKLSAEGFAKTFNKLSGGALIIGKAAELAPKAMERMYHELEGKEHGLIVVMTDGSKKMEQFRHENEKFLGSFTAIINIRPLNDKALVAYARDYAMSQDYSIDEFGQLALAQRIAIMQTSTHQVTLKEVRALVDEAIDSASKISPLKRLFSKNRFDENDRIILHEKDFTQA